MAKEKEQKPTQKDGWQSQLQFNPIFTFVVNESLIGIYKGSRKVAKIQSLLHAIEVEGGQVFDFYGCGSLDHQLADIKEGTEIKIFYAGKKSANVVIDGAKMKKDVHNYVVYTK